MKNLHSRLDLIRGDLGESWLHRRAVGQIIWEQLPTTIELATASMAVGMVAGIGMGMLSAMWRVTWLDTLVTAISTIGLSTPTYWSGLLAILLFSLTLRWLPPGGAGDLRHLVLPTLVLGFSLSGSIARLVRARVVEVIERPFIVAARARGLPAWRILFLHVLRPALGPAIAVAALQFSFLLSGAVVTESVFARRGLGKLALEAILTKDIPVVRGIVLVSAVAYVLVNLAADLILAWLDPCRSNTDAPRGRRCAGKRLPGARHPGPPAVGRAMDLSNGIAPWRIAIRYILLNAAPSLITFATTQLGWVLLNSAALNFLGLGVELGTPEWGAMLAEGRGYLREAPWASIFPGLALTLTVLATNLLGDGLQEALGK